MCVFKLIYRTHNTLQCNQANIYYVDTIYRDKKVEYAVIEIPTNDVVRVFTFKEDAEEMAKGLSKVRPFGREPLPKFLKDMI